MSDSEPQPGPWGTEWRTVDGKLHRDGGLPAVEWANGDKEWWVRGQLHRECGLPAVEDADGTKIWYEYYTLHRDSGLPAIEHANGYKEWRVRGQQHRDGGLPAVERADGSKEWWFWGEWITEDKAQRIHRLLCNRAYRQRWRKVRRLVELAKSKAFNEWFYHPDRVGGRWAKKDLERFVNKVKT